MIRIVLLDDHQLVREGTKILLESEEDMRVVGEAGDPPSFLQLLEHCPAEVAIVDLLLDDRMSGFSLIEEVHRIYPEMRILVVSMFESREYVQRAFDSGASGYVPKKEAADSLIQGVRTLYSGRSFISPLITEAFVHQRPAQKRAIVRDRITGLTRREEEIFHLLGEGKSRKDIAALLNINQSTVGTHFENMKMKLELDNLTELVHKAIAWHVRLENR